jgi:hypothetical protein
MGTDKRQRAIAKRLKRKDARERGKARDRRETNKAIRQERAGFPPPLPEPLRHGFLGWIRHRWGGV